MAIKRPIEIFFVEPNSKPPLSMKIASLISNEISMEFSGSIASKETGESVFNALREVLRGLTESGIVEDRYYRNGHFLNNDELCRRYENQVAENERLMKKIQSLESEVEYFKKEKEEKRGMLEDMINRFKSGL